MMLLIKIAKLELTGGHIEIMIFKEIENLVFPGGILKLCYL